MIVIVCLFTINYLLSKTLQFKNLCLISATLRIFQEVSRDEARKRIMAINEPYKLEILEGIKEEPITIYHIGNEWWDLCAGPHVESTGKMNKNAIELESVAGAYWRGDESKPMLQRIYGTAWENEEQLKAYINFKEEAKRRDHRRLGQDLDLFSIQDGAGGGLVFWHPKGATVRHIIEDSWRKVHIQHDYQLLYTPHVAKADLWKISGHLDFYKENMFDQMDIEGELYQLRPMNCPYHILLYKRKRQSYRDLPIRVAELGTVYRYELSGSLHGLFRVRGFTQDDAHIFCLDDQIKDEISGVLDLTECGKTSEFIRKRGGVTVDLERSLNNSHGVCYTCENIQCPYHDHQLGFRDMNSRNNHQYDCKYSNIINGFSQGMSMMGMGSGFSGFQQHKFNQHTLNEHKPFSQLKLAPPHAYRNPSVLGLGIGGDGHRAIDDLMAFCGNRALNMMEQPRVHMDDNFFGAGGGGGGSNSMFEEAIMHNVVHSQFENNQNGGGVNGGADIRYGSSSFSNFSSSPNADYSDIEVPRGSGSVESMAGKQNNSNWFLGVGTT